MINKFLKFQLLVLAAELFLSVHIFPAGLMAQNIGINTDGTSAEAGVILDLKGANSKTSTTALQNIFQIKSFDASTDALKLRLGLATNSGTPANQYGVIDVPEYSGGSVSAYRHLALQPLGGNVGIGTSAPNTSAQLEVGDGTDNKGLLIPRVALTSTTDGVTITSPANSLLVYNSASGGLSPAGYYYNSGTAGAPNWAKMASSASGGTCCSDWTLVAVANATDAGTGPFSSGYVMQANKEYLIFGVWSSSDFTIATTDNVFLLESSLRNSGTVTMEHYYNFTTPVGVTIDPVQMYLWGKRLNGNAASSFNLPGSFIAFGMTANVLGDGTIRIVDSNASNDYAFYIFER
jgi:hypothetical protein